MKPRTDQRYGLFADTDIRVSAFADVSFPLHGHPSGAVRTPSDASWKRRGQIPVIARQLPGDCQALPRTLRRSCSGQFIGHSLVVAKLIAGKRPDVRRTGEPYFCKE